MAEDRVFFRDIKPYDVPDSLDDLRGPDGGVIVLPFGVDPVPGGRSVDLDEDGLTGMAYEAILQEGTTEEIVALVNRDRLRRVWAELVLPTRARDVWEGRFPELASS